MAKRAIAVEPGDTVQIWTVDQKIDPNFYTVGELIDARRIRLTNEYGKRITVHATRIAHKTAMKPSKGKKMTKPTTETEVVETVEETTIDESSVEIKSEKVQVDFDHLKATGELWSKDIAFNHSQDAIAHVWIADDGQTYRTFNTYDGSLGAKGKPGKTFTLEDEKALEKKRKTLEKKGYVKQ